MQFESQKFIIQCRVAYYLKNLIKILLIKKTSLCFANIYKYRFSHPDCFFKVRYIKTVEYLKKFGNMFTCPLYKFQSNLKCKL